MNTFLILLAILAVMTGGTYFLSRPKSDSGEDNLNQTMATVGVFCLTALAELLYALVKLVASL